MFFVLSLSRNLAQVFARRVPRRWVSERYARASLGLDYVE